MTKRNQFICLGGMLLLFAIKSHSSESLLFKYLESDETQSSHLLIAQQEHKVDRATGSVFFDRIDFKINSPLDDMVNNDLYKLNRVGVFGRVDKKYAINTVIGFDIGYQKIYDSIYKSSSIDITGATESFGFGITGGFAITTGKLLFELYTNFRPEYLTTNWSSNDIALFITTFEVDYSVIKYLNLGVSNKSIYVLSEATDDSVNHDYIFYYLTLSFPLDS